MEPPPPKFRISFSLVLAYTIVSVMHVVLHISVINTFEENELKQNNIKYLFLGSIFAVSLYGISGMATADVVEGEDFLYFRVWNNTPKDISGRVDAKYFGGGPNETISFSDLNGTQLKSKTETPLSARVFYSWNTRNFWDIRVNYVGSSDIYAPETYPSPKQCSLLSADMYPGSTVVIRVFGDNNEPTLMKIEMTNSKPCYANLIKLKK
jgi:hypothetical protein